MTSILMVCMGNICRSPMARTVAQQLAHAAGRGGEFTFDAAGTHVLRGGEQADARARSVLSARHYPPPKTRSRRVTVLDFERFDLILAMDKENLAALDPRCPPEHRHKLRLLLDFAPALEVREVPDPYYGNLAGFERVLDLCEAGAKGLLQAHPLPLHTL